MRPRRKPSLDEQPARGWQSLGCLFAVCAAVAAAGLAWYWVGFGSPAARLLESRSWPARPCTIRASSVGFQPVARSPKGGGKEVGTYSADILYACRVGDHVYESDRYDFLGRSIRRKATEELVARYPPGAKVVGYVNPADPREAVLSRAWSPFLLFGFLPLAIGLAGLAGCVKVACSGAPTAATGAGSILTKILGGSAMVGSVGMFFWLFVIAADGWERILIALLLLPFGAFGLAVLLSIPGKFLALWSPRR